MAKLHRARKAVLHTTTFLGVSANFTTQNPGVSVKIPTAKFTTANLSWHYPPPPRIVLKTRKLLLPSQNTNGPEMKRVETTMRVALDLVSVNTSVHFRSSCDLKEATS